MKAKKVEVFCGTGGVGKTTLATARAAMLAKSRKVLLITIDPAKRLKQLLKIEGLEEGLVHPIVLDYNDHETISFDSLLLQPRATLFRALSENRKEDLENNNILKILTKPYGGLNEVMAIIEVQYQLDFGNYDTVVLDTPPGKHFIDFLAASDKIGKFFDQKFVEVFQYLESKSADRLPSFPKKVMLKFFSSGIKKLLKYLKKVTGDDFLEEFVETVALLYDNKALYLKALDFRQYLSDQSLSNWFFVTSADQSKVKEALSILEQAQDIVHGDNYGLINRCLRAEIENWRPPPSEELLVTMRETMLKRENELKMSAKKSLQEIIEFPEVFDSEPQIHLSKLIEQWERYQEKSHEYKE